MGKTALIMAGGKGSRLSPEKPIIEVCGRPLIMHVIEVASRICDRIVVATVKGHPVHRVIPENLLIYTSGRGYEEDIIEALLRVGLPTLVLPADLFGLTEETLKSLIENCTTCICNLTQQGEFLGVSFWRCEDRESFSDLDLGQGIVNVNMPQSLSEAREKCGSHMK